MRRNNSIRFKLAMLVGCFAIVTTPGAQAGTQADYVELQAWCVGRDKWDKDKRQYAYPNPEKYFHFHHYCGAMRAMKQFYRAPNKRESTYAISQAKGELSYIISHAAADHILMPEVYALRGKAEYLGNFNYDAELSLVRALQLDPNHVGAHITLVDLYVKMNRKADTIKAVRAALAIAPEHKGVRRIAKELGVEVPEIAAQEKRPIDAPAQPEKPAPVDETKAAADTPAKDQTAQSSNEADNPKPDETKPTIGMPGNPYCRFCPDTIQP
jgi:hypothetical protein